MSGFDEARVRRDRDGRFAVKAAAPPAASLGEKDGERTVSGAELVRIVASMVRKQLHRAGKGTDVDDLIQTACLNIGNTYGFDRIPKAPIWKVVSATIARSQGHSNLNSTDRRAMTAFNNRRQDLENELGRELSWPERQAVAQEVRENWPDPRHKPSKDFLERARLGRVDGLSHRDDTTAEGNAPWAGAHTTSADPSTTVGAVEATLNGPGGFARARLQAWNALAEIHENDRGGHVPRAVADLHTARAAAWARSTMDDYPGGVLGAVDRWGQAGEDEGTVVLFAPFGDIDEADRDAVCEMLARHRSVADELWSAALAASTRHRQPH